MREVNIVKQLIRLLTHPFRRKVFRSTNRFGNEWLIVARKREPHWEETDLDPKAVETELDELEEMADMIESGDIDEARFAQLEKKLLRRHR